MDFTYLESRYDAMKTLVRRLNETYRYASLLGVEDDSRNWSVTGAGVNIGSRGVGVGTGFVARVFDDTGCAEYSFNELSQDRVEPILQEIASRLEQAKAALPSGIEPLPTPLPADEPCRLKKQTPCLIDPRVLGDQAILDRLGGVRQRGLAIPGILDVSVRAAYRSCRKIFLSRERELDQTLTWMTGAVVAMAARGEEIKDAYIPFSNLGGAEVLEKMDTGVEEACRVALELLDSEPIPPGVYDCVCTPDVTGMIVHEAFGHGVEMDMFVKDRAQAREFVGQYVASPLVTMHDGSAVREAATFFFDDEGTLSSDTVVIDKGILKGGFCDALSAARLGVVPTGNGRRESYERKVYTRMTNTYFEGGTATPEELIAQVKDGLLLEMPTSGMEDPKNWGIQMMVSHARQIKDGKLTGKIYSPIVMTGYVPDLLKSIRGMGRDIALSGSGYCGKGHKEWVKVSDGGPYILAKIRLG